MVHLRQAYAWGSQRAIYVRVSCGHSLVLLSPGSGLWAESTGMQGPCLLESNRTYLGGEYLGGKAFSESRNKCASRMIKSMTPRISLLALLTLGVQASLSATTLYSLGTLNNISFADESNGSASAPYVAGVWTEDFTGGTGTTQQIVCVVALTNLTDTCGNGSGGNGPGNAVNISLPANSAPTNTGILPGGVTNYIEIDGDNQYGAPVSTPLTGLSIGTHYTVTFYQASNEEIGSNQHLTNIWQTYLIPGSTPAYITATNGVDSADLVNSSTPMDNLGARSTPWQQQTFTFTATSVNEVLEFVTNATVVGGGTVNPPLLDLTGVSYAQATPEPGAGLLTLIGGGLVLAGSILRRRTMAKK